MSWIQTYTGIAFDVLVPKPEQIAIEDIAHALSNLCRFAGHCRAFYSIAQHSVLVSRAVPPEHALQALLHDAPEAYCVDIPRPLKRSDAMAGYRVVEERLWLCCAVAFGVPREMHRLVKQHDTRALLTEQRDLMGPQAEAWRDSAEPYAETIVPLPPRKAKVLFLDRFAELTGKDGRAR